MKKSTMMLIAGSLAAVVLSGCNVYDSTAPATARSRGDAFEQRGFVKTGAINYVQPNAYGLGTGMNQSGGAVPAY